MSGLFRFLSFVFLVLISVSAECGGSWQSGGYSGRIFCAVSKGELEECTEFIAKSASDFDKSKLDEVLAIIGGESEAACTFILRDKTIVAIIHSILTKESNLIYPNEFRHSFLYQDGNLSYNDIGLIHETVRKEVTTLYLDYPYVWPSLFL